MVRRKTHRMRSRSRSRRMRSRSRSLRSKSRRSKSRRRSPSKRVSRKGRRRTSKRRRKLSGGAYSGGARPMGREGLFGSKITPAFLYYCKHPNCMAAAAASPDEGMSNGFRGLEDLKDHWDRRHGGGPTDGPMSLGKKDWEEYKRKQIEDKTLKPMRPRQARSLGYGTGAPPWTRGGAPVKTKSEMEEQEKKGLAKAKA